MNHSVLVILFLVRCSRCSIGEFYDCCGCFRGFCGVLCFGLICSFFLVRVIRLGVIICVFSFFGQVDFILFPNLGLIEY
jgi:hypothetical protein